jgi:integrase/recombinase XerC
MPLEVAHIHREHVESFTSHLLETRKPATANNRYRGLQSFFKWLVDEGEIQESPMARMKPPRMPEAPPDVLCEDQLKALLARCDKGNDFESRRDTALIRVFIDTGARLSEVTNISVCAPTSRRLSLQSLVRYQGTNDALTGKMH